MENLPFTLDLIGKIMVAYTALAVHGRVRREQRIDSAVFRAMKKEKIAGIAGVAFMILGYIMHITA
ncbi:hypothetical protein HY504_02370 [Candidatus Wolfebacteria bacterium]|nr:hypothetical protein [Candidatus Wolfebacteria bacterium]